MPTKQCDVPYLCLEDTQRRIKDRLYSLTDDAPKNLHFAVICGLIGSGLEEQITELLNNYPKTKLVIIDTLQKVRDSKGSAGKAGMYGNYYDDISSIKRIADDFNISIILMHHLRKLRDGDDPFNEVSGSTGISNKPHIRKDEVAAHSTYGTPRVSAYKLLEDALNLQNTRVYDTVEDAEGKEKRGSTPKKPPWPSRSRPCSSWNFRIGYGMTLTVGKNWYANITMR